MTLSTRPRPWLPPKSAFTGFRFPPEVIVVAVRWYLPYSLSYRDVEELLVERGIEVDHATVYSAAAVGQGEAVADGVVVLDQAGGEAGQLRDTAGPRLRDPGVQALALTLAQHAGEVADEPVDGSQAVTPLKDAGQAALFIFGALAGGRMIQPVTSLGFGATAVTAVGLIVPSRQA